MAYDPTRHKRRSIRLKRYDYRSPGAYFITICTHQHLCILGSIVDGSMRLNDTGRIVADEWRQTAVIRNEIELDEWVVMPNHFHGIVFIVRKDGWPCRGDRRVAPTQRPVTHAVGPKPKSIGAIMAGFKSAVTRRVNQLRRTPGANVWQRNYWEHVIRSELELNGLREYIRNNPAKWTLDRLYVK